MTQYSRVWKYSLGFAVVDVDDDYELHFFPQDPSAYFLSTVVKILCYVTSKSTMS
jgi:hypothetical protein